MEEAKRLSSKAAVSPLNSSDDKGHLAQKMSRLKREPEEGTKNHLGT